MATPNVNALQDQATQAVDASPTADQGKAAILQSMGAPASAAWLAGQTGFALARSQFGRVWYVPIDITGLPFSSGGDVQAYTAAWDFAPARTLWPAAPDRVVQSCPGFPENAQSGPAGFPNGVTDPADPASQVLVDTVPVQTSMLGLGQPAAPFVQLTDLPASRGVPVPPGDPQILAPLRSVDAIVVSPPVPAVQVPVPAAAGNANALGAQTPTGAADLAVPAAQVQPAPAWVEPVLTIAALLAAMALL